MATLAGYVYNSSGNPIAGATVRAYVHAENATVDASGSQITDTTDANGRWDIVTTTTQVDIKITFGDSVRWLKAGDDIMLSKLELHDTLTVGKNDLGYDVIFYGGTDSANMTWDASEDDLILSGAARIVVPEGQLVLGSAAVSSTAAELNLLDGVSGLVQADFTKLAAVDATAAELDLLDGDTSVGGSITIADTDGFVVNDGGTMKTIPASDITTYVGAGDITGVTAGAGLSGTATSGTASLALDLSSGLSDVTPANGDKLATLDSDGSTEQLTTLASLATLFAGTGLTASSSVIGVDDGTASAKGAVIVAGGTGATVSYSSGTATVAVDASQAITALTGGDLTIYEDANNADVSLKMGTSATESLTIQVLNGSSNKTAEEVHFSTATASGTANHGAMVFDVDGTDILTINDGGLSLTGGITASGIVKTDDATDATSTTDGSLQTDGGLSVVKDGIFGNDVTLITDSAVLNLGVGSDVSITHDGTTGGTITGTPMVYESKGAAALANDTHAGVVLEFLAAESIAVGQLVYMSTTDGRVGLADANAAGKFPAIGVAVSAQGSAGSAVKILTHGTFNDSDGFSGDLTEGNVLYLSETAGAFTATAPSDDGDRVQVVGIAIGPRDVFISPSLDVIEHD